MGWENIYAALSAVPEPVLLVGGFAVNAYGYTRNTLDVDLLVSEDHLPQVKNSFRKSGFSNLFETVAAVHCEDPESGFRIDLLPVSAETFSEMLRHSQTIEDMPLPVVSLRDLIALKLHALMQQPEIREDRDVPDIAWLCRLNDVDLEDTLKPLCMRYATLEWYERIQRKIEVL